MTIFLLKRFVFPARAKGHYKLVGIILGWSLLHGGSAGHFFSTTLYDVIAYGVGEKDVNVDDVQDYEVLENLNKV